MSNRLFHIDCPMFAFIILRELFSRFFTTGINTGDFVFTAVTMESVGIKPPDKSRAKHCNSLHNNSILILQNQMQDTGNLALYPNYIWMQDTGFPSLYVNNIKMQDTTPVSCILNLVSCILHLVSCFLPRM